jgi:proline dehydrogenase
MDIRTKMFRSALLAVAGNRAVESLALKYGLRLGAAQFVAGETLSEALDQAARLNCRGIRVTLDYLGENVKRLEEAEMFRDEYIRLLHRIRERKIDSNVSLKPTQMGLSIDPQAAYGNIRQIVAEAKALNNFVRIDMEDSPHTEETIRIVRELRAEGLDNVGTVIQAYLYRSAEDVRRLTEEKINLRLVKGAYKETIAYPEMRQVNENFVRLIRYRLDSGVYTAIATHDDRVIDWTKRYVTERGIARDKFEFQMLYGIRMPLQEQLAKEGYGVRCYVPYGKMWYAYFVRRLAERPANALFVLKNLFRG